MFKVLTFEATLLVILVRLTFWNPRIEIPNYAPAMYLITHESL